MRGFLRGRRKAHGVEPCGEGAPREARPGLRELGKKSLT